MAERHKQGISQDCIRKTPGRPTLGGFFHVWLQKEIVFQPPLSAPPTKRAFVIFQIPSEVNMQIPEIIKNQTRDMLNESFDKGVVVWDPPFLAEALKNHGFGNDNPYQGGNAVITELYSMLNGYKSKTWLTFARFISLQKETPGMRMKDNSHSVCILRPVVCKKKDKKGNYIIDPLTGNYETFLTFSRINVFNADCFTGYEFVENVSSQEKNLGIIDSCDKAEKVILSLYENPPKVYHDVVGEAFYAPALDEVHLPPFEQFKSIGEFISTLCHELAHSTGAKGRLNRKYEEEKQDSETFSRYSFEELVAEITSALYCVWLGYTQSIYNSASYISAWKARLDENIDWFFRAFSYAEKAFEVLTKLYDTSKAIGIANGQSLEKETA